MLVSIVKPIYLCGMLANKNKHRYVSGNSLSVAPTPYFAYTFRIFFWLSKQSIYLKVLVPNPNLSKKPTNCFWFHNPRKRIKNYPLTSVWLNCRFVLRLTFYLNLKFCNSNEVLCSATSPSRRRSMLFFRQRHTANHYSAFGSNGLSFRFHSFLLKLICCK